MEFTLPITRVFNIEVEQFEKYLLTSGWKRDEEYYDSKLRFTPVKRYNIQIALPTESLHPIVKGDMMRIAVETLARYLSDDVESVIESINSV